MIEIKENEFIELTDFIKNNFAINLAQKKNLIEGRLHNLLVEKGFSTYREYLDCVYKDPSKRELTTLINKLTTNHTFFMRESEHFNYFKNTVLPYIANVKDRDLRIWSAGCSSGEEPYTLAMIMDEYFGEEKALWDKKILATDISVNVLESAENGIYSAEALEKVAGNWKHNYFNKVDNENYKVSNQIKNEVIFRIFNLKDDFPFKRKFHVIFCRNVMIYFDKKTKERIINKFYDMTERGGYLFIGLSESINREETAYHYIMPSVFRKG